jgi:hypothetical protein
VEIEEGYYAIPYSPYSTLEIVVYNGTSFATGALGAYLGQYTDEAARRIYEGFIKYLNKVMWKQKDYSGRFWYYCDPKLPNLTAWRRGLIDHYHQMQQVEMHAIAQQASPVGIQKGIIEDATDYIVEHNTRASIVPYYNKGLENEIHLWGLCSVASGLLEAAMIIPEKTPEYQRIASSVVDWMVRCGWNGEFFEDIVRPNGDRIPGRVYMVRSDAWVFNTLAAYRKHTGDATYDAIIEKCYCRMEQADFSGPETHAFSLRRMYVRVCFDMLAKLRGSIMAYREARPR